MLRFVVTRLVGGASSAERYVAFEAGLHANHCAAEKSNYSIVGHDEADVPFLPRPTGERDCEKVDAKNSQPNLEPRSLVNVSLCDLGVKIRLRESRDSASDGDRGKEDERKLERAKPMNHLPSSRALPAFGDHLPASRCESYGRAHGQFRGRAYIPCEAYFFAGVFQPLAAIILQTTLHSGTNEKPTTLWIIPVACILRPCCSSHCRIMKRRRIFWIATAAGIFLAVLAAVGTSMWIDRFLHSDAFRKLIGTKTGEAFDSEAVYGPLRWTGSSLFSDSIEITAGRDRRWKACASIKCERT